MACRLGNHEEGRLFQVPSICFALPCSSFLCSLPCFALPRLNRSNRTIFYRASRCYVNLTKALYAPFGPACTDKTNRSRPGERSWGDYVGIQPRRVVRLGYWAGRSRGCAWTPPWIDVGGEALRAGLRYECTVVGRGCSRLSRGCAMFLSVEIVFDR